MASFDSTSFGRLAYKPDSIVEFPNGLPGFEERRQFLVVTFPHTEPLVFLQSLEDAGLCFVTLPVLSIDRQYHLEMNEDDLKSVGLAARRQPRIGADVACLAVLTLQRSGTTANLLAPVVINIRNLKAVQAIAQGCGYSHQHVLRTAEAMACS
jgi:flagellar assembly factor FliW